MNIILFDKLEEQNTISMKDERARHIKKILHLQKGDKFDCGIINSSKGVATITEINNEILSFSFESKDETSKTLLPVTLLVCQVRPICMKRILREAVSLGVEKIILSGADLTEKSYRKANFYVNGEYKKVLIDGAMQASHTGVSEVVFSNSINESVSLFDDSYNKIMLDNIIKGQKLSQMNLNKDKKTVLAIGPERGFSDRERDVLIHSSFKATTIGKRVLRTETACSAGIAILLGRLGLL